MKAELRLLENDFKAAARIGQRESLEGAFARLRALPEAASNQPLSEAFLSRLVPALAASLALPRLPAAALRPFLKDPLVAVRSVAAAALGKRYQAGLEAPLQDLLKAGRDARPEVRRSLAESLGEAGAGDPARLWELVTPWIQDSSPRLRHSALLALAKRSEEPGFIAERGRELLEQLEGLQSDPDPEVRGGLAAVLTAAARNGLHAPVLDALQRWAGEPEPSSWVISQVLSAAWAAQHLDRAGDILKTLEARTGLTRYVTNARRALERHAGQSSRSIRGG